MQIPRDPIYAACIRKLERVSLLFFQRFSERVLGKYTLPSWSRRQYLQRGGERWVIFPVGRSVLWNFCQLLGYGGAHLDRPIPRSLVDRQNQIVVHSPFYNNRLNPFFQMQMHPLAELTADIHNSRIRELIASHKNLNKLLSGQRGQSRRKQEVRDHEYYLRQFEERRWLIKKGRKYLIDFDNEQRKQMKRYFNSLDQKKTGSIGIDELEQLLFSVGLFQTREEIKALIDSVDEDHSGKIEFGEFLSMIQNDQGQNQEIVSFFKTVIGGRSKAKQAVPDRSGIKQPCLSNHKSLNSTQAYFRPRKFQQDYTSKSHIPEILQKYPYPKGLPFQMVVSHIRRKHMMTALNIGRAKRRDVQNSSENQNYQQNTVQQIAKGQRVMHSLQKMYERKLIKQIKQNKRIDARTSGEIKLKKRQSIDISKRTMQN